MSELPAANRGTAEALPPADTGTNAGISVAMTAAAAVTQLAVPKGAAYFSFQPRGGDVYLRFKSAAGTPGTTAVNGVKVPQDVIRSFWVYPGSVYVDYVGSATGTLFYWQSSPNYDGRVP